MCSSIFNKIHTLNINNKYIYHDSRIYIIEVFIQQGNLSELRMVFSRLGSVFLTAIFIVIAIISANANGECTVNKQTHS